MGKVVWGVVVTCDVSPPGFDFGQFKLRHRRCDIAVLLVDAKYNPNVQYFCRCALATAPDQVEFAMPEDFPFAMKLATTTSRLSTRFRALHDVTSDELCTAAASRSMIWEFIPLFWAWPDEGTLLDIDILGSDQPFEAKLVHRVARRASASV